MGVAVALLSAVAVVGLVLFFVLPVAAIVLLIMLIVARRTASQNQIRTSLAAIDAQLRMLGASGAKSDRPPTT